MSNRHDEVFDDEYIARAPPSLVSPPSSLTNAKTITSPVAGIGLVVPIRACLRFAACFKQVRNIYDRIEADKFADLRIPDLVAELLDPTTHKARRITGRQRFNIAKKCLDSFGLSRSEMQRLFHNHMFGACAPLIFGVDLEAERDDLLLELGITKFQTEFMAITPRRFGKTYSVAMFVVAMALAVEGIEQSIFSTGRRASQKLLELIFAFICKIPGMKEMIIKHNVETIWLQGPGGKSDIRKISSYPSKVKISSSCVVGVVLCVCAGSLVVGPVQIQSKKSNSVSIL
jgi:hypothetical protein